MANSTPNYGYNSDLPAIHGIDADLRRVEDKADANGQLAIQVARNDERIIGLDKRIGELKCTSPNTYCKETIDCKLDSKASKCEFEKHLTDCDAHKKLFNQKVDKKDGCRLICEDELQQIRDDIEDRYTKDKIYTQAEVNEFLSSKVNKGSSPEYDLPVTEGFECSAKYSINENNRVFVYGSVRCNGTISYQDVIAVLPDGFRPKTTWEFPASFHQTFEKMNAAGTLVLTPDGKIDARVFEPADIAYFNFSFLAQ